MERIDSFDQDSNTSRLNKKNKSTTYSYSGKVFTLFFSNIFKQN